MEEAVIDDIISLESSLNDEYLTLIDSGLQLANTVRAHGEHLANVQKTLVKHVANVQNTQSTAVV